ARRVGGGKSAGWPAGGRPVFRRHRDVPSKNPVTRPRTRKAGCLEGAPSGCRFLLVTSTLDKQRRSNSGRDSGTKPLCRLRKHRSKSPPHPNPLPQRCWGRGRTACVHREPSPPRGFIRHPSYSRCRDAAAPECAPGARCSTRGPYGASGGWRKVRRMAGRRPASFSPVHGRAVEKPRNPSAHPEPMDGRRARHRGVVSSWLLLLWTSKGEVTRAAAAARNRFVACVGREEAKAPLTPTLSPNDVGGEGGPHASIASHHCLADSSALHPPSVSCPTANPRPLEDGSLPHAPPP